MQKEVLKNFIVLEGLDGSGTSTQSKMLSKKIPSSYLTFEPTDNRIGTLIRDTLKKRLVITPLTLAHLFVADRSEHLFSDHGIVPRCKNGQIVISDRYLFSSLAYQPLKVPFENVLDINSLFPMPEIAFFLDTPIDICQERINVRGNDEELFERHSVQEEILANYEKAFQMYKNYGLNAVFIDGSQSIKAVHEEILNHLKEIKII